MSCWNEAIDITWTPYFGLRFFPYQLGLGVSISWRPIFRAQLYVGPLRMWVAARKPR